MTLAGPLLALLASALEGSSQDTDNSLKPLVEVPIKASIGEMAISPDANWVYLLNLTTGKLQRLDIARGALDPAAIELMEHSRALAVTPNGKTLYVAAAAGTPNDGMSAPANAPQGTIQIVDAASFQLKKSHSVDFWPFSIAVTDSGTVFAAGKHRVGPGGIVSLDGPKIGRKIENGSDSSQLRLSPDQKWVSTGLGAFCRFSVSSGKSDLPPNFAPATLPSDVAGGPYVLTPDGAFQVGSGGAIVRLLKPKKETNNLVTKIVPHRAAAFDADAAKLLFVTTPDGSLKIFSVPGFEQKATYRLQAPIYRAAYDRKSHLLYGAAHDTTAGPLTWGLDGLGDLHIYDLSKVLAEALK